MSGYTLGVRDSIMIAHSFKDKEFGPAQSLHGATYTVEVEFQTERIEDRLNWVIDIGEASNMLSTILSKYNYKNLDELFPNINTTTEFMCQTINNDLCQQLRGNQFKGKVKVTLQESHKAWASFIQDVY